MAEAGKTLRMAFQADYVVFGGGNARSLTRMADGFRKGGNHNAYFGGVRMWEQNPWETLELDSGLGRQQKRA